MYFDSSVTPRGTAMGSNELAEGFLLLRASTLKIIRLQLAIERHDRCLALEAMDDLVALDRRLQDYLDAVPATAEGLMFRRELDSERAALNEEKLTLAAEVRLRPANGAGQPIPKRVDPKAEPEPVGAEDDWLGPRDLPFEPEEPGRSHWRLVVIAILASGPIAAAYLISTPDSVAWLLNVVGALR